MTSFSALGLVRAGNLGADLLITRHSCPALLLRSRDSMIGSLKKVRYETRDNLRALTHVDLAGCARFRATQRSRSLSVFPHALGRRRPRHSHSEGDQS